MCFEKEPKDLSVRVNIFTKTEVQALYREKHWTYLQEPGIERDPSCPLHWWKLTESAETVKVLESSGNKITTLLTEADSDPNINIRLVSVLINKLISMHWAIKPTWNVYIYVYMYVYKYHTVALMIISESVSQLDRCLVNFKHLAYILV